MHPYILIIYYIIKGIPYSTLFPYTTLFRSDFTACTMLPVLADGTPLCELPEFAERPHAYVKLWKHHVRVRALGELGDRKSTRLNSSHVSISYAVFCLKKKIFKVLFYFFIIF